MEQEIVLARGEQWDAKFDTLGLDILSVLENSLVTDKDEFSFSGLPCGENGTGTIYLSQPADQSLPLVECHGCKQVVLAPLYKDHIGRCTPVKNLGVDQPIQPVQGKRKANRPSEQGPRKKAKKVSSSTVTPRSNGNAAKDVYNPDKHCGVLLADNRPCKRSLLCKQHSISKRRQVSGRSQNFDLLLVKYRADKKNAATRTESTSCATTAPTTAATPATTVSAATATATATNTATSAATSPAAAATAATTTTNKTTSTSTATSSSSNKDCTATISTAAASTVTDSSSTSNIRSSSSCSNSSTATDTAQQTRGKSQSERNSLSLSINAPAAAMHLGQPSLDTPPSGEGKPWNDVCEPFPFSFFDGYKEEFPDLPELDFDFSHRLTPDSSSPSVSSPSIPKDSTANTATTPPSAERALADELCRIFAGGPGTPQAANAPKSPSVASTSSAGHTESQPADHTQNVDGQSARHPAPPMEPSAASVRNIELLLERIPPTQQQDSSFIASVQGLLGQRSDNSAAQPEGAVHPDFAMECQLQQQRQPQQLQDFHHQQQQFQSQQLLSQQQQQLALRNQQELAVRKHRQQKHLEQQQRQQLLQQQQLIYQQNLLQQQQHQAHHHQQPHMLADNILPRPRDSLFPLTQTQLPRSDGMAAPHAILHPAAAGALPGVHAAMSASNAQCSHTESGMSYPLDDSQYQLLVAEHQRDAAAAVAVANTAGGSHHHAMAQSSQPTPGHSALSAQLQGAANFPLPSSTKGPVAMNASTPRQQKPRAQLAQLQPNDVSAMFPFASNSTAPIGQSVIMPPDHPQQRHAVAASATSGPTPNSLYQQQQQQKEHYCRMRQYYHAQLLRQQHLKQAGAHPQQHMMHGPYDGDALLAFRGDHSTGQDGMPEDMARQMLVAGQQQASNRQMHTFKQNSLRRRRSSSICNVQASLPLDPLMLSKQSSGGSSTMTTATTTASTTASTVGVNLGEAMQQPLPPSQWHYLPQLPESQQ
ncbi:hormone receptor 4-like isoform X2 [Sycon ciliatum]|uniref:hormone receptor 4-like isoform X2 n=1 Tax=Sycon ciliatum TaxID=27933 RepID=UPI0031F6E48A